MVQKAKNIYHLIQAHLATRWYKSPSKDMVIIGVTGTDGKTTTSSLIYHVLREAGYKTALISTVSAVIDGKEFDTGFHVSTPGSWQLQSYIQKAKKAGVTHLVLEVTSHGLDQNRVAGIEFSIGVLTNVTREHLDYHETMERYRKAKGKLLKNAKTVILNRDDSSYDFFSKYLGNKDIVTYGLTQESMVNPKTTDISSPLQGEFNVYNTLASVAVLQSLHIDEKTVKEALKSYKLPTGRYELVFDEQFSIIIDFAHTPNSLSGILSSVKKSFTKGKLIHVFGSAGERDKGKRKLMGEESGKVADVIVLTAEDSRKEDVMGIISDIKKGIPDSKTVVVVPDRQEAITQAVMLAQKDDVVLITGKGHEKSMNLGMGETEWSEHDAVRNALEYRKNYKKLLA